MNLIKYNPKNTLRQKGWTDPDFFRFGLADDLLSNFWNTCFRNDCDLGSPQIKETNENYLIRIEVPGYTKEEVKAEISEGTLTIRADHKEEKKDKINWQINGSYNIQLLLPEYVDTENANADLKDGVLIIDIPKKYKEAIQIKIKDGK